MGHACSDFAPLRVSRPDFALCHACPLCHVLTFGGTVARNGEVGARAATSVRVTSFFFFCASVTPLGFGARENIKETCVAIKRVSTRISSNTRQNSGACNWPDRLHAERCIAKMIFTSRTIWNRLPLESMRWGRAHGKQHSSQLHFTVLFFLSFSLFFSDTAVHRAPGSRGTSVSLWSALRPDSAQRVMSTHPDAGACCTCNASVFSRFARPVLALRHFCRCQGRVY